jgi:hypothetical protein
MRYLKQFFLAFIGFWAIWIGAFYIQLGNPVTTPLMTWAHEVYEAKDKIIQKTKGNKVLIVAGSNALFGLDSGMLQQRWNMPVVNYAVYAGLQLPYLLEKSKKALKSGDIVLLPLEYDMYVYNGKYHEMLLDYIIARDKDYFLSLPIVEQLKIINQISASRILRGFSYFLKKEQNAAIELGPYSVKNISQYGDQINLETDKNIKKETFGLNQPAYGLSNMKVTPKFKQIFGDFVGWAKKNRVCVIVIPPTFLYYEEYRNCDSEKFFDAIRSTMNNFGVPFVGDPFNYMYDKKYYFDTIYHLNGPGGVLRTKQIMADIGDNPYDFCVQ